LTFFQGIFEKILAVGIVTELYCRQQFAEIMHLLGRGADHSSPSPKEGLRVVRRVQLRLFQLRQPRQQLRGSVGARRTVILFFCLHVHPGRAASGAAALLFSINMKVMGDITIRIPQQIHIEYTPERCSGLDE
jgi:hypothetical protein